MRKTIVCLSDSDLFCVELMVSCFFFLISFYKCYICAHCVWRSEVIDVFLSNFVLSLKQSLTKAGIHGCLMSFSDLPILDHLPKLQGCSRYTSLCLTFYVGCWYPNISTHNRILHYFCFLFICEEPPCGIP